eukprot:m.82069 g.82069  ORF g.82069 m.82069 type:complete len:1309 (-) comp12075_c2_seq1:42-3968(-)
MSSKDKDATVTNVVTSTATGTTTTTTTTSSSSPSSSSTTTTTTTTKGAIDWSEIGPLAWFLSSSANSAALGQHLLPPALALALARPGKDAVVIPDTAENRELIDFYKEIINLKEKQIVFSDDAGNHMVESNNSNAGTNLTAWLRAQKLNEGQTYRLMPRKFTRNVRGCIADTVQEGLLLPPPDISPSKHTSSQMLYPHISKMDVATLVSEVAPQVTTPKGYVVSTPPQLMLAFEKLGEELGDDVSVVLCPIHTDGAVGRVEIFSKQELALYDFPHGDVVLREALNEDKVHLEGLPFVVYTPMFDGKLLSPVLVLRNSNGETLGVRSCDFGGNTALMGEIESLSSTILKETRFGSVPAGAIEFCIVDDKPIATKIHSGFQTAFFSILFADRYAPAWKMYSWTYTPSDNLDVWTYWYRLYDQGLTFRPMKKKIAKAGVFPLFFRRDESIVLIAVAPTEEKLHSLRSTADQLVIEPTVEEPLERVGLADETVRRIWCGGARPEYRRETQRYNLPNRCIGLVRPKLDLIILPGNHKPTQEHWNLLKEIKGLSDDQVIFTSNEHFVMDDDINDDIVSRIKAVVTTNPKDKFTLVPYTITDRFERWSSQLSEVGVTVFGESLDWVSQYGHKGILHRNMWSLDVPSLMETFTPNITVARGYTCRTQEHLVKAWELLECDQVVVKPVLGAAGEGILFISDVEQLRTYDFPMGDVLLEEFLQLDRSEDGVVLSPAVHYYGNALVGKHLVDQIMVGVSYSGWRKSQTSKNFTETCIRATKKILKAFKPRGPGGFDFLSVDGIPYLTDVNTGRFNGAHYPKMFHEMFAKDKAFYVFKHKPPPTLSATQFWLRLQSSDIAFVPGQSEAGVFPLIYLRGLSGLYIALANTEEEAADLAVECKLLMQPREAPTLSRRHSVPDLPTMLSMTLIKNADAIYTPDVTQYTSILLAGKKIIAFLSGADVSKYEELVTLGGGRVVDATGHVLCPGFIDPHVHLAGGGGEMGPLSRTPEVPLQELINSGITTAVGITGTDDITRSLHNLLSKVQALNDFGLTGLFWTGSYRFPTPTITRSVKEDIVLIEQCIGVGELAVADHRGSQPSSHDLQALASQALLGGMLVNKAGIVHVHVGNNKEGISSLRQAIEDSCLPTRVFYPTHMSRNKQLVEEAADWIKDGGYVDFTACSRFTTRALAKYFATGVDLSRVTVSSDGGGSSPKFDKKGKLVRYGVQNCLCLLALVKKLYYNLRWPLERILPLFTRNPAQILKLESKGGIEIGMDADILLLDVETLDVKYVFGNGELMKSPTFIKRGMFDDDDADTIAE